MIKQLPKQPLHRSDAMLCGTLMIAISLAAGFQVSTVSAQQSSMPTLTVKRCADFSVTGQGDAAAWEQSQWQSMQRRGQNGHDYTARFKMLYSANGVYVLFDGSDEVLTATLDKDFADLWTEDVYECFFWTDEAHPIYFEYEISPLGYELPILVPNLNGRFLGWRPWNYDGARQVRKAVAISGGPPQSMAKIDGWRAEVFIPFDLLKPLSNVPPKPGTRWRANFYRIDYDGGRETQWDWARVGINFHDFNNFGTVVFE
jgi:hypothetical protein